MQDDDRDGPLLGIVLGLYVLRRPSMTQSSFYQPVKLKNTGHQWPADITGLELAFTNHQYGREFAAASGNLGEEIEGRRCLGWGRRLH